MSDILKINKAELFKIVLNDIKEYEYRDTRYSVAFCIVAVYCKESFINMESLQKKLRKTDKVIYLNDHLFCVVLDGVLDKACEKVAENINYHLLEINAKYKYYLSATDSKNYNLEYRNMIQNLFERLEYAIENNLENIVIYQDYVV